jgi:GT2 family glycosyltransferase
MRKLALAGFVLAALVALVVLTVAAAGDEGDVAFTNDMSPLGEVVSIPPGAGTCDPVRDQPATFDGVRLTTIAQVPDQPFRVTVRARRTRRVIASAAATAPAGYGLVQVQTGRVTTAIPNELCVTNTGRRRMGLVGGPGVAATERGGVNRVGVPTLVFTTEPRSLLDRLPDALERAALFKPGWMGTWTFWLLAASVLLGVPALLAAALARASASERPAGGAPARYARFRSDVEPKLTAAPRVHRFAAPPLTAGPDAPGVPVAVCIEPRDDADPAATRASLERQTRAPAVVLEGALGDVMSDTTAPWIACVRAGDELAPIAVERLGQGAVLAGDAEIVTCDEDELNGRGRRDRPRFRPGPSPDLLLAHDLAGSLVCVKRERAAAVLGPDWRYRAALLLGGPAAKALAHVPAVLCHCHPDPANQEEHSRTAAEAMTAWGDTWARVELVNGGRRVRRAIDGEPSVEVIVLFRDRPALLERCVESILGQTTYENLRLRLVDNGSRDPAMGELLRRFQRDSKVDADRVEGPFNFAALNNAAAAASRSDYLRFLNNDTELMTPSWIEDLLEEAQRPDVGAVAPLLLYPDGRVQHAGAALGMHDYAGHPFAGLAPEQSTPFGSATDGTRNWLAVTAACMLVERRKFEEVGGFDDSFVVAGNDVDLCLRLTAAGYRSLCIPHVRLVHDESKSRRDHIDPGDFARSEESYGRFRTVGDPFYNPNLTLRATDCGLRGSDEL